ncbi:MAG: serine/threonine protein kinase [Alphaproteobacteria bacterium]|nr:serine/threonine protein kinase [Alphaproteobacteria bacterium]
MVTTVSNTVDHFMKEIPDAAMEQDATDRLPEEAPPVRRWGRIPSLPTLTLSDDETEAEGVLADVDTWLRVQDTLGEGGSGIVHRAAQPLLEREVAIKRARPEKRDVALELLLREARIVAKLEHPNIVPLHTLGQDPETGEPLLVMKLVQGTAWSELIGAPDHAQWSTRLAGSPDPLVRNVEILVEVCRAVHFAHTRGVLHRDIKPSNVMIGAHGEVHLLDWGAAAELHDPDSLRRVVGTPTHMPPETLDPTRRSSVASDVFMLGACLHQILMGRPPHVGDSAEDSIRSAFDWMGAALPPSTPRVLRETCTRALERDPQARHPTAQAFELELTEWLRNRNAILLTESALARLEQLDALLQEAEPDPRAVTEALTESRFGLREALLIWPESPEARGGLERALRLAVDWELSRGGGEHARHALAELEALGVSVPEAHARLEALEQALAERDQRARTFDPRVGSVGRGRLLLAISLAGFLMVGGIFGGVLTDPKAVNAAQLVRIGVIFNVVMIGMVLLSRRWVADSAQNRGFAAAIIGSGLMIEANRVLAWRFGLDVHYILVIESTYIALASTVLWPFVSRWMLPFALMWYGLAALGALVPSLAFGQQIVGFSVSGALAILAVATRR